MLTTSAKDADIDKNININSLWHPRTISSKSNLSEIKPGDSLWSPRVRSEFLQNSAQLIKPSSQNNLQLFHKLNGHGYQTVPILQNLKHKIEISSNHVSSSSVHENKDAQKQTFKVPFPPTRTNHQFLTSTGNRQYQRLFPKIQLFQNIKEQTSIVTINSVKVKSEGHNNERVILNSENESDFGAVGVFNEYDMDMCMESAETMENLGEYLSFLHD